MMLLIGAAFLASCGWTVLVLLHMSIGALPTSSEWRLAPPLPSHTLSCPEFIIKQVPASLAWRTQMSLPPVLLIRGTISACADLGRICHRASLLQIVVNSVVEPLICPILDSCAPPHMTSASAHPVP
ncbi:uncharacterized protein UHOD_11153 [Ustilago sp. UG-2017b]|nr:uncharacterized protein UHOD_11153 [Ustilago sp. UG-2017b]